MSKSITMTGAALALFVTACILLPAISDEALAQSAPLYINAVDIDVRPPDRFLFSSISFTRASLAFFDSNKSIMTDTGSATAIPALNSVSCRGWMLLSSSDTKSCG